jgi:hemerythrin superfamily protein
MDIYQILKSDHKEVSNLFKKLEDTSDNAGKTRDRIFGKLHDELKAHSSAEEEMFYPRLKDNASTRDLVAHALHEHQAVDRMLAEMSTMESASSEWSKKCKMLHKMVEDHVKEEENKIFPEAKKILSDDEAKELGKQFKREEDKMLKSA